MSESTPLSEVARSPERSQIMLRSVYHALPDNTVALERVRGPLQGQDPASLLPHQHGEILEEAVVNAAENLTKGLPARKIAELAVLLTNADITTASKEFIEDEVDHDFILGIDKEEQESDPNATYNILGLTNANSSEVGIFSPDQEIRKGIEEKIRTHLMLRVDTYRNKAQQGFAERDFARVRAYFFVADESRHHAERLEQEMQELYEFI